MFLYLRSLLLACSLLVAQRDSRASLGMVENSLRLASRRGAVGAGAWGADYTSTPIQARAPASLHRWPLILPTTEQSSRAGPTLHLLPTGQERAET